jgi:hypothetical protein
MTTSPSDDAADEPQKGEILKASAPGLQQIEVGMEVETFDGHRVGLVKEIHADEFLLDRPLAPNLWVPSSSILATEDYSSNVRGPVQPTRVVLNVSGAHIDRQGWRHA